MSVARSAAAGTDRQRSRRNLLIKLAFSVFAVGWLASTGRLNPGGAVAAIANASLGLILLALFLHVIGIALSVIRWRYLLLAQGTDVSPFVLTKYLFVSFFFNVFLPTNIGGDVIRVVDTARHSKETVKPVAVILVERISGLLTLLGFMVAVLALGLNVHFDVGEKLPGLWLGVGYVLGLGAIAAFLLFPPIATLGFRLFGLPGLRRIEQLVRRFYDAVMTYREQPRLLAKALVTGFLLQLNYVLYYVVVARALGISAGQAPVAFFFLVIPIRDVLLLLPFFINGIGIREIADVKFFHWVLPGDAHAIAASANAFSWLSFALAVIYALIGGVVFVLRRQEHVS
jgi:glycosyltransferase 2 family protein